MGEVSLDQRSDFRSLVDQLDGICVWIVSDRGAFEYVSAGFEDIWGIPVEEVVDDPSRVVEAIHPDDREQVLARMRTDESAVSSGTFEERVVRPDGSVRWVKSQQFPLRGPGGELDRIVGSSVDVTEQKRREAELETLNRILRHDIRNDVSVILGWAEMLADHVDDAGEEHRRKILNAGDHIVDLTETARDYAELISSGADLDPHPVALRPHLQSEIDLRRESFPAATFDVDGEIPDVDVNANEMVTTVFRNLLTNAVQHNDRDDPVVEIECTATEEDVVVETADDGPGIPDAHKDAVFEKGERGIGATGTGLGLHIVETLVDAYGGDVWITDNSPRGAVFHVRLDRAG